MGGGLQLHLSHNDTLCNIFRLPKSAGAEAAPTATEQRAVRRENQAQARQKAKVQHEHDTRRRRAKQAHANEDDG